jgi:predicted small metal-binding protein
MKVGRRQASDFRKAREVGLVAVVPVQVADDGGDAVIIIHGTILALLRSLRHPFLALRLCIRPLGYLSRFLHALIPPFTAAARACPIFDEGRIREGAAISGRRDAVKTLACKDTGMQCNWVGRAETEQELLNQATQHVKQVHNMDMTPEKAEMARKVIKNE